MATGVETSSTSHCGSPSALEKVWPRPFRRGSLASSSRRRTARHQRHRLRHRHGRRESERAQRAAWRAGPVVVRAGRTLMVKAPEDTSCARWLWFRERRSLGSPVARHPGVYARSRNSLDRAYLRDWAVQTGADCLLDRASAESGAKRTRRNRRSRSRLRLDEATVTGGMAKPPVPPDVMSCRNLLQSRRHVDRHDGRSAVSRRDKHNGAIRTERRVADVAGWTRKALNVNVRASRERVYDKLGCARAVKRQARKRALSGENASWCSGA